jgi:hypothetical protein
MKLSPVNVCNPNTNVKKENTDIEIIMFFEIH